MYEGGAPRVLLHTQHLEILGWSLVCWDTFSVDCEVNTKPAAAIAVLNRASIDSHQRTFRIFGVDLASP